MPPVIEFTAPPLPHYITSGLSPLPIGGKHPSRKNIGAFDLLVVVRGCLYVEESGHKYEITEGHALILLPDSYHYSYEGCKEETLHYWTHFQILGEWRVVDEVEYHISHGRHPEGEQGYLSLPPFAVSSYTVALPQFTKLAQPQKMAEAINELNEMNRNIHLASVRLRQQTLFQEVIMLLSASLGADGPSPQSACAERAASYLREHYREPFSAIKLGEAINFHPVYIARCMQKVFGCSPSTYLLRLRIDQSKLLLIQTDLPVERVAEEVGFNLAAYFTASFTRFEGMSPRKYRQRFAWNKP
ncbi:helix-turn-helix protein [Fontibacillus phaseoli]|uniref:Helix-turn-helix protein n=1 Tax=Fontibacillus phaseoli TaxID=1416533 RepID=A0A369B939_9BACL|nr:AraC family transcriptional regulator [Fontibacillus phaseoli]RCX16174.1 helix-turn-helix protein [Fontibacillus phaseoli]